MKWVTTKRISTFTDVPYAGNPAWVIIGVDASEDDKKLLKLTSELNPISDTVFVSPVVEDADLYLRFFSQCEEINFSGHGTIATYFALEGENVLQFSEPITLLKQKTKSGVQTLELRVKDGKVERVTVSLSPPQFISMKLELKQIATCLNITPVDISDVAYPIGIVSFGLTDLIIPVKSLDLLLDIKPNFQLMKNFCERFFINGVVVYSMETIDEKHTAHMRHFAPTIGINEEPVSGASGASLGGYLVHNQIIPLGDMTRLVVEQGNSMQRPGLVYIHVHGYKNQILRVTFGGQGIVTFEGRILLPQ